MSLRAVLVLISEHQGPGTNFGSVVVFAAAVLAAFVPERRGKHAPILCGL